MLHILIDIAVYGTVLIWILAKWGLRKFIVDFRKRQDIRYKYIKRQELKKQRLEMKFELKILKKMLKDAQKKNRRLTGKLQLITFEAMLK